MMLQIPFVGNRNFQSCEEIESNRLFEVLGVIMFLGRSEEW